MIALVGRLVAMAIVLQTLELWQLRRVAADDDGIWRAADLADELTFVPRAMLGYRAYRALIVTQLVAALAASMLPHAALFAILLGTSIFVALRFRGSFNGGSDFMTIMLLGAVIVGTRWPRAALLYVAVVTCNSYFIAGIAKLRTWRSGATLRGFLSRSVYQPAPSMLMQPVTSMLASWLVLAIECAFPLVLVSPAIARVLLPVMLVFHVGNAWVFGLNRFLPVWLAAYPAIWACSGAL